jgi:hypothetical protein
VKYWCDEVLVDVPTDNTGRATCVAMSATMNQCPRLDMVMGFLIEASVSGTGKTTVTKICHYISYGRWPSAVNWEYDDEVETNKVAVSLIRAGVRFVGFDNIRTGSVIKSSTWERILTAGRITGRILGSSTLVEDAKATIIPCWTGNSVMLSGELPRRVLRITLGTTYENPRDRPIRHRDFAARVNNIRVPALRAMFTILRYASTQEHKDWVKGRAGVENLVWDRMIGWPLEHAFELAGRPVSFAKMIEVSRDDDECGYDAHRLKLLEALAAWTGSTPFTVAEVRELWFGSFAMTGHVPTLAERAATAVKEAIKESAHGKLRDDGPPSDSLISSRLSTLIGVVRELDGVAITLRREPKVSKRDPTKYRIGRCRREEPQVQAA